MKSRQKQVATLAEKDRKYQTSSGYAKLVKSYALIVLILLFYSFPVRAADLNASDYCEEGSEYCEVEMDNDIYVLRGNIYESIEWRNTLKPYIVTTDIVVRQKNTTDPIPVLTIEADPEADPPPESKVEVRFESGTELRIGLSSTFLYKGAINAKDAVFTSDAEVDGIDYEPAPEDYWSGIYFTDAAEDSLTVFDGCEIKYGGAMYHGNIYLENASPTISNNIIRNSRHYGIYADGNSFPIISGNTFFGNGTGAVSVSPKSAGNIKGSLVKDDSDPGNFIEVRGGNLFSSSTWKKQEGLPFVVLEDIIVRQEGNQDPVPILTIEAGTELRFERGAGLRIGLVTPVSTFKGSLNADGTTTTDDTTTTTAADTTTTTVADTTTTTTTSATTTTSTSGTTTTTVNGWTTFTANESDPAEGDWKGIYFSDGTDDETTFLRNCNILNGGAVHGANIYLSNASPEISGNIISNSSGYGIFCDEQSFPIIDGNDLSSNEKAPIICSLGAVEMVTENTGDGNIEVRGGEVYSDVVWNANNTEGYLPFVITRDIILRQRLLSSPIPILTVSPGAEMRFASGTGLQIGFVGLDLSHYRGGLVARGDAGNKTRFTSDSESPGSWKGIYFTNAASDADTFLDNCTIGYAGAVHGANLYLDRASPIIRNSEILYRSQDAIYVSQGSYPVLANNTFDYDDIDNGTDRIGVAISIFPDGARFISGNSFSGEGGDYIEVRGGEVYGDALWPKQEGGIPFVVTGDVIIRQKSTLDPVPTLTVAPGVQVQFSAGTGLMIGEVDTYTFKGILNARGTLDPDLNPTILFTAADGSSGGWNGIWFSAGADPEATVLQMAAVEYGIDNITIDNTPLTLQYNVIRNAANAGVNIFGENSGSAEILCNRFIGNNVAVKVDGVVPLINYNSFSNSTQCGVSNVSAGGVPLKAINNYWGVSGGPNSGGDIICGEVDASPWLIREDPCLEGPEVVFNYQLINAISVLQLLVGLDVDSSLLINDINNNSKIDLAEAIFVLQVISGIREP